MGPQSVPDSLADWLQWLEQLHPAPMALGLDRIGEVYKRLALDFSAARVVTVAGTNGKGSVVALLQALLLSSGHTVGAYTSPHISRYNERIALNGVPAGDDDIVASFQAIEAVRDGVALTYFEYGTLAALHYFARHQPQFLLLEVGLGGRLDAVNLLDPDVAVVTSIALDHQAWLGDSREAIAVEKAGIFRAGVPVVCGDGDPPQSLLAAATSLDCPLMVYDRDFRLEIDGSRLQWSGRRADGEPAALDCDIETHLLPSNIATALQVFQLLPTDREPDWHSLGLSVAGRQEVVMFDGIEIILDVAHNPAATQALADFLRRRPPVDRCVALFAVMSDKDISGMVSVLRESFDAWFLGDLTGNARALPARDLAPLIHAQGIHMISVSKNIRQAFARAVSLLAPGQRLVVFGSLFTVAAVRAVIDKRTSTRRGP